MMGHYYRNLGEDISDNNFRNGLVAIDSALHNIEAEVAAQLKALSARVEQRAVNYRDSGGRDAFSETELEVHAKEEKRLKARQTELGNLRFAIGAARRRTEWLD